MGQGMKQSCLVRPLLLTDQIFHNVPAEPCEQYTYIYMLTGFCWRPPKRRSRCKADVESVAASHLHHTYKLLGSCAKLPIFAGGEAQVRGSLVSMGLARAIVCVLGDMLRGQGRGGRAGWGGGTIQRLPPWCISCRLAALCMTR